MEPEKTKIDAILDAYDHRLVEARQREAEQESREADFGRKFAHFRDEVAELIMTSVGLQLESRGHGSEIRQEDQVHAVDNRQETMPAIAFRMFPGSLHPVPGVERYPSLTLLGARREQKVIVVTDARLKLPGDEDEQDPRGGKDGDRRQDQGQDQNKDKGKNKDQNQNQGDHGNGSPPNDQQDQNRQGQDQGQGQDQKQGQDQQQGQQPQQQKQEPTEETMDLFELTPQRLRDRLTQLVADAFGRLPRAPH